MSEDNFNAESVEARGTSASGIERLRDPAWTRVDFHDDPGCHWIGEGTWLKHRGLSSKTVGVVSDILDVHESGTVKILWRPNSTEYVSVPMFVESLRDGRLEVVDS